MNTTGVLGFTVPKVQNRGPLLTQDSAICNRTHISSYRAPLMGKCVNEQCLSQVFVVSGFPFTQHILIPSRENPRAAQPERCRPPGHAIQSARRAPLAPSGADPARCGFHFCDLPSNSRRRRIGMWKRMSSWNRQPRRLLNPLSKNGFSRLLPSEAGMDVGWTMHYRRIEMIPRYFSVDS